MERHPRIASLPYAGLPSFPQFELVQRQMSGSRGGLVSFDLDGRIEMVIAFMNHLQVITRAVSLGDAEALIQHPASMTHAIVSREDRLKHGISDGLRRLSIGLESVEDILDDLTGALDAL